jgi:hypothetical protein
MYELLDQLSNVADKIKSLENNREKLGQFLKEVKENIQLSHPDILESKLTVKVNPDALDKIKVIGIDGGLSQHEYHGMDMILTRAVATVFDYAGGKLGNVEYFPSSIVTPKLTIITDPYNDSDFMISTSIERQKTEIDTAIKAFEKYNPELILLDGSILPHCNDKPGTNSMSAKRYDDLLAMYRTLYKAANGRLAGCIEDSRGRRFCEMIAEKILPNVQSDLVTSLQKILAGTRDTNLLYHILDTGERTCVFRFSKERPIEGLKTENIYTFYIKTANYDRPVRVDFYAESEIIKTANKVASIVLATSCHSSYGFPAPLIEADCRAKLKEMDIDALHDQLVDRVGITPGMMKLRREQRPF